jgi:ubiquitin C-terminal hydrolase
MVFEKGGCLGGEQFVSDSKIKREPKLLVFSEMEWEKFAKNDKAKLTEFLIGKLSDTTKTKVHTCPFFAATNGEMAVYSLQHIHNKNWLEFAEFKVYKNKEYGGATDQPQIWLQNILKNETERKKLAELFLGELKK